jgi:transcription termination factor Rho
MTDILERPAIAAATKAPPKAPAGATAAAPLRTAAGVLDLARDGSGRLRGPGLHPSPQDPVVPRALVRRHALRPGDLVDGTLERPGTLGEVRGVDGLPPGRPRPHFADLTPVHPHERLRLESPLLRGTPALTARLVDLMAPVGKGQRGLIAAPPKAGKTVLLQTLAAAIAANHPECHLMVLLVDERPEEVTDMRARVREHGGEVLASTFDEPARRHIELAELALERAKRMVERGRDVVLLLDSLTRLCRAHNTGAPGSGRTLSGGVDAAALAGPKRFFGAARRTEEAGSLTILASALVDTGSRADDFYFEELKGTGNMELRLDRALAQRAVHPALDLAGCGTRRDELLLSAPESAVQHGLRRALAGRDPHTGIDALLERLRKTPDNAAFVRHALATVPSAG